MLKRSDVIRSLPLLLLGLLLIPSGALAGSAPPLPAPHAAPLAHPAATHGDLIVGPSNSPYVLSPTTTGSTTYYEQGNITVLPGGQLYVDYLTIYFVQFIADNGTAGQRASHIYNFTDQGLVVFANSTLTTDIGVLNPYAPLNLVITDGGAFSASGSQLLFPGGITVNGTRSALYVNQSIVAKNPAITGGLQELIPLRGATEFSPTLTVQNGARTAILSSQWNDYFADNFAVNGQPLTNVSDLQSVDLASGQNHTFSSFALPTPDAPYLALSLGLGRVAAAYLGLLFVAPSNVNVPSGSVVNFDGAWNLGALGLHMPAANTTTLAEIALPQGFVNAVNTGGMLGFLQATGQFGTPSTLSVHIGNVSGPVSLLSATLDLIPEYPWNMTVASGSTLTVADSRLDLNWNVTWGTAVTPGLPAPTPWGSQKLVLSGGSLAFLANVSVPSAFTTTFDNQSMTIPLDANSQAYFYRWGVVHVSSATYGPIADALATTYSAYNGSEGANATVTYLNDFASADPDLAGYLATWATLRGFPYGTSDATGTDPLLLATSVVSQSSLPTGNQVGTYHINVRLSATNSTTSLWHYSSVTPYPIGLSPASWDTLWNATYSGYKAQLSVLSYSVLVNGAPESNSTVAIGENLTLRINVTNAGAGSLFASNASLAVNPGAPLLPSAIGPVQNIGPIVSGAIRTLNFTWTVNESALGDSGAHSVTFLLTTTWNDGVAPIGGSAVTPIQILVEPAYLTLTFNPPTGQLQPGQDYQGTGTLGFAGTGNARVNVTLTGPGGSFLVGSGAYPSGSFLQAITIVPGLQAGGTYSLNISAAYNHRTVYHVYTNAITIAGSAPAGKSFLEQSFLGLPFYLWLVIAAGIVLAAIAVLLVAARQARGKLVECGECGELIPEDALICPKCGAEFEADLVRCSRCGSTIPAKSAVCPECAATLLGSPGSEASDPERQGYADFVERFRAEAKKELQENYGEGAFWDWYKRQPNYVSFSQWKLQQSAGSRAGMAAPTVGVAPVEPAPAAPPARKRPPTGGAAPPPPPPAAPARPAPRVAAPPPRAAPPPPPPAAAEGPEESGTAAAAPGAGMRACANCGKEIPSDFLVCPFCGAVTR